MKRHRTKLSLLLGLVFLVQGVAVSAAPYAMSPKPEPVAMTMDAGMPCHGQMDGQASTDPASCCDADCPDMSSCMLGHLALASAFQLATTHVPDAPPLLNPVRLVTRSPPTLLRPPITLHG